MSRFQSLIGIIEDFDESWTDSSEGINWFQSLIGIIEDFDSRSYLIRGGYTRFNP